MAKKRTTTREPLIIQYTNLLNRHKDPLAPAVKRFLKLHADDEVFVRRAQLLNRVQNLKPKLT